MDEKIKLLFGGDIQFDQVIRPPRRLFRVLEETEMGVFGRALNRLSGWYFDFSTRHPSIDRLLGKMTGGWFDKIHKKWIVDAYSNKQSFPLCYLLDCKEHKELYEKLFPYKEEVTARSCRFETVDVEKMKSFPFQGIRTLVRHQVYDNRA
jgi:hypothetical protein